ncbi:MAG: PKD domain-containing protein [Candidatus Thermoplasmatota archaeon]|nr:PKD domain-containing protein [Candidatus Thermoplasmatota archaeon]
MTSHHPVLSGIVGILLLGAIVYQIPLGSYLSDIAISNNNVIPSTQDMDEVLPDIDAVAECPECQEHLTYGLGLIPILPTDPMMVPLSGGAMSGETPLPDSWDWRNAQYQGTKGDWTTSAKDQKLCGSCWDFAAHGALEAVINIARGDPTIDLDLSEQYILSCYSGSEGCDGGNAYYAFQYMKNNGGTIPESCFPYTGSGSTPCSAKCADWEEQLVPIKNYQIVKSDREVIKTWLYSTGPLCLSFDVYDDFYHGEGFDDDGVYTYHWGKLIGSHQVVAVGYVDDPLSPADDGYWICKNSWGRTWGPWGTGFFGIAYGECHIEYYSPIGVLAIAPPIADFSYSPSTPDINTPVSFHDASTDPDGTITSWLWNFGDTSISTDQHPTHSYSSYGTYTVTLTVTDDDDASNTTSQQISVGDVYEPDNTYTNATIIATDNTSQSHNFHVEGDQDWVSFDAVLNTTYLLRTFELGDECDTVLFLYDTNGTTLLESDDNSGGGCASRIEWVCPTTGVYYAKAEQSNASVYGLFSTYSLAVSIMNYPPVANFSYLPAAPLTADTIYFSDTSLDNDGTLINWTWDFGDGNSSSLQHTSHQYVCEGTYVVTLTVIDDDSAGNSTSQEILVSNTPPTANFTFTPENVSTTSPLFFTDTSTDPDGDIVSWLWEFGDGTTSTLQHPTYQYQNKTDYIVTLNVSDDAGAWNTTSQTITVVNVPPTANFTVAPLRPLIQETVWFNDTSFDSDGEILSWGWDFGDGNSSTERNATHAYASDGTYTIVLHVTDDDGGTANHSTQIKVTVVADVFVDDDAIPEWYDATHVRTIQEGIDNATTNQTVYVYAGTYYEHVLINTSLLLVGEDADTTIVDGMNSSTVLSLLIDGVIIDGLSIQHSGPLAEDAGIRIGSSNNTVVDCRIRYNTIGISLTDGSGNTLLQNVISDNNCGVSGNGLGGSFIYHNTFLNNTVHAIGLDNSTWDDGYPSGGNYWDDYTGNDTFSGEQQNISGSDGIGDSPYAIDGGSNVDQYPLMYPFDNYVTLQIDAPSTVDETESFVVTITTLVGEAVADASVLFNAQEHTTDALGQVTCTAPSVTADTSFPIVVFKENYTGNTSSIIVENMQESGNPPGGDPPAFPPSSGGSTFPQPSAHAGGPYTGYTNISLSFNGSQSTVTNGTITTYLWDFGDSTTGSGALCAHLYTLPGNYTVVLTVTDSYNQTDTDTTSATILQYSAPAPEENNTTGLPQTKQLHISDTYYELIDTENDGVYDTLRETDTGVETAVELLGGLYYLDTNGDGKWEYTYDPITGTITSLDTVVPSPPEAPVVLYASLAAIMLCATAVLIMRRRKKHSHADASHNTETKKEEKIREPKNPLFAWRRSPKIIDHYIDVFIRHPLGDTAPNAQRHTPAVSQDVPRMTIEQQGITSEVLKLLFPHADDCVTADHLVRALHVPIETMNLLFHELEHQGYITRRPDSSAQLTDKGRHHLSSKQQN